jgi:hypothetical protein
MPRYVYFVEYLKIRVVTQSLKSESFSFQV